MKRSKNGIDGSPAIANIPEEIIFYNILTRIPDKSLNRFRCVCKQWSNLPDDPLFKSSYSHHRRRSNHQTDNIDDYNVRGFICCENEYLVGGSADKLTKSYFFSFLDIDNKECKQIPFQLPSDKYGDRIHNQGAYVNIVDSLNGVLLLRFAEPYSPIHQYYVYNPGCGCGLRICPSDNHDMDLDDYFLAYDPIISIYKVVGHDDYFFYIFTVDGVHNSWRCFSKPRHYTRLLGKPVYVDYALHWICRKRKKTDYGLILRLNASKEEVSIIKLPVKGSSTSRRLIEMGGLLWFIHSVHGHNHQLKLWWLKKKKNNHSSGYRDDHEWVAKCSINLATVISSQLLTSFSWSREPVIIVTDPKCRIIFTFVDREDNNNRCIYSYDIELKHWDLIHAGPVCFGNKDDEGEFHYWYDNKKALCLNNVKQTKGMRCLLYNGACKWISERIIRAFSNYYKELKQ